MGVASIGLVAVVLAVLVAPASATGQELAVHFMNVGRGDGKPGPEAAEGGP